MPPRRSIGSAHERADDRGDQRADHHRRQHRKPERGRELRGRGTRRPPRTSPGTARSGRAKPVITVIDRKMIDSNRRRAPRGRSTSRWRGRTVVADAPGRTRPRRSRVILREPALRSACGGRGRWRVDARERIGRPCAGARRSARARAPRSATTNGSAGMNALAMMLLVGRYCCSSCWPTPSSRPPAYASGMLPRPPITAAAIAAITSAS